MNKPDELEEIDIFSNARRDMDSIDDDIKRNSIGGLSFGVSYLDDALISIARDDLILIGGRSGGGKTELAVHIANVNAAAGHQVCFFALEAKKKEISHRILYKKVVQKYFEDPYRVKEQHISYSRWINGRLQEVLGRYHARARQDLDALTNLDIRYSKQLYTLQDFEKDFLSVRFKAKLIIIDHLHYFGLDDGNENAEYKKIVTTIRNMALEYRVPIILVSHIRKADHRFATLVPEQEDFHGSSDIIKVATKAITIASGRGKKLFKCRLSLDPTDASGESMDRNLAPLEIKHLPSFMKTVKNREAGETMWTTALLQFNPRDNTYGSRYYVGEQKSEKGEAAFVAYPDSEIPLWAEEAVRDDD